MHRQLFGALLLITTSLVTGSAFAQGLGIARGTPRVLAPLTYEGRGFDPPPSTGRLDSDYLIPLGAGMFGFGDSCTSGPCVNIGVRGPGGAFTEGLYAIEGAPLAGRSLGLQSGAINPIGVRLRLTNADTITLPAARIVIDWGARSTLGLVRGSLQVRLSTCDGTIGATLTPRSLETSTSAPWVLRRDEFIVVGDLPVGADVCVSFINTALLGVDVIALTRLEIAVPTCGNHLVEVGEACDLGADDPCACDPMSCQIPIDGVPCEGEVGACFGHVCRGGACVRENLFEGFFLDACDDGDPCTFDGCRGGACAALTRCDAPTDACHVCDPTARLCDVPIPSCCVTDADCPASDRCHTSSCGPMNTCELTPTCSDADLPDAGSERDASVFDASFDAPPLDAPPVDAPVDAPRADGASLDAPPPVVSFAGGGGCRCVASSRRRGPSVWPLALVLLWLVRRRR